jgi:hypothetical protein
MSRTGRKHLAWLCLSAVLLMQLAVAAYACTTRIDGGVAVSAAMASASHPCAGMDQELPKLCEQHCVSASQSVDTQPHSLVNAPVQSFISVSVRPDPSILPESKGRGAVLATVVDPPPLVRFGVLRI